MKSEYEERRLSAYRRGYTRRWAKARLAYLQDNPLCRACYDTFRHLEPATVVDHIVDHKGNKSLFWDKKNWQGLCKTCHDAKTFATMQQKEPNANAEKTKEETEKEDRIAESLEDIRRRL